jgi:hypothetical protein
MSGAGKRPDAELHCSTTTASPTPAPGTGEGAQTALLALIKKRKLSSQPETTGEVPEPPPGSASDP